jgi:hypothetical protein
MILLSHEVKLKLQDLLRARAKYKMYPSTYTAHELNRDDLLDTVDELVKLLPPEVTDGVTTNVEHSQNQSR